MTYARRPSARTLSSMPTCAPFLALTLVVTATCYSVRCQEAPIGEPDPLRSSAGAVIEDAEQWRTIRRPEVLILDEATSHLDTVTEEEIHARLARRSDPRLRQMLVNIVVFALTQEGSIAQQVTVEEGSINGN